jgi:RNA polymerase sigma-70 factor, ECF subfamily
MKNPFAEKILFLRVKNKDHQAYGEFYDLYIDKIYRFIYFKVNSVDDAQDLTSEVFLKVWQHIRDDKKIRNLNAFTYMVARNAVIDFYRQKCRKEENEESATDNNITLIDQESDLLVKQIKDSEAAEVLAELKHLKDEYREAIILHYLDQLSIKEIAQVLNKTPGASRVLIHRATNALKEAVNKKNQT